MTVHDLKKPIGWALIFCALTAQAATTDLAGVPLVTSSPSAVLPNIMYVLDDSGSMDWSYLPDWANSSNGTLFKNADYNGVYYNPAITYTPPTAFNSDGTIDSTTYPSQTSANTAAWTSVKDDGYGVQSSSSSNLIGNALFYTMVAGEYCSAPNLRTCVTQSAPSVGYPYPAKLRWCTTSALTNCQAVRIETGATTYKNPRYPSPPSATITVGGSGSTAVSSIKVNGFEILSAATSASTGTSTVASRISSSINNCSTGLAGNCQVVGYTASRSGSTVTITAPGAVSVTPMIATSGSMTFTLTAFSGGAIPGSNLLTVITSTTTSYPYPGTTAKAATRTDCAASTCTYAEEMTNYANWWSYYHTRMQTMKTAVSIAFAPIGNSFRVGYLSINDNTAQDFLNIAKFDNTQKKAWYTKFFNAVPNNSTPLRTALSKAGRLYAGKLNGTTLNGSTVSDPMQYSCQQNFTIMSTDGYWNEAAPGGYQLDGSTAVGDQDGGEGRPYYDGTGTSNTLSDVTEYYYVTDLRTGALLNNIGALGTDVATNNVPSSGLDGASWQHMTTFTLGLGASGYMQYSPSYMTATSGDFFDVKNGTTANPSAGICSWQSSGACNWPTPVSNTQPNIDDLWHAAVNGRGSYFSAGNPAALSIGLGNALAGVSARSGASAAATTSNPNVTSGDNFVFSSTFTTTEWAGELVRQHLDLTTGVTSSTIDWAAQARLDANSSRTLYTYDPTATSRLKIFQWTNLTATEQAYFNTPNISTLSQFCAAGITCLSAATQASAAGAPLVNFLNGDRSNEGAVTDTSKYYRQRTHVLGDIVNAEAAYVKTSLYNYADFGYSDFITSNATRQGMVYAAANDGMLHAFYSANGASGVVGGEEAWAYIPALVLPNLFKLADKNYANLHQYYVDGTPTVGDICASNCTAPTPPATTPAAVWKTILVGGLNGGGRGYYALDITDPASPKALWQFTDSNLGYTYGNPKITKLKDGTWVVLVASGYNNVSPGDGQGRLYVLNALTGAIIRSISTGVGSATAAVPGVCSAAPCPSGLAKISARVVNPMSNNTVLQVYGGDLYGNLWRFDVNGDLGASGYDAQLLATLKGASGNIQPVTTKPELGTVGGYEVVFVGTGQYLGSTDLADATGKTFYAIKDPLTAATTPGIAIYPNPRTFGGFVQQTLTITTCPVGSPVTICKVGEVVRTSSSNTVNFATNNGWYLDLPDSGERANTDPSLALGTLAFNTNIPSSDACTVGGYSNRYFLDYRTGSAVSTSTTAVVGVRLGNALATRPVFVRLPNNTIVELSRMSDGTTITSNVPIGNDSATTRRVSWRQLANE